MIESQSLFSACIGTMNKSESPHGRIKNPDRRATAEKIYQRPLDADESEEQRLQGTKEICDQINQTGKRSSADPIVGFYPTHSAGFSHLFKNPPRVLTWPACRLMTPKGNSS